ncbi:MAG: DUF1304 domain-containing protein [Marmoricola sp.]
MTTLAYVLLALAALVHCYIFWLESFAWTSRKTRAIFGTTAEQAQTTKQLAYNQGFYNLFLAVGTAIAIVLGLTGHHSVSTAVALVSAGSMVAAALVLVLSDRSKLQPAAIQGVLPALGLAALLLG